MISYSIQLMLSHVILSFWGECRCLLGPFSDHLQVIQVLSDVKEEDRNLTWAEIKERSSLAARARRDGG